MVSLGEEASGGRRTIRRALLITQTSVIGLYLLFSYAATVGWGLAKMAGFSAAPAPLLTLTHTVAGPVGEALVTVLVLNSIIGVNLAVNIAMGRMLLDQARMGAIPRRLARIHPVHHTPVTALTATVIVQLAVAYAAGVAWGLIDGFIVCIVAATAGAIVSQLMANIGLILYRDKIGAGAVGHGRDPGRGGGPARLRRVRQLLPRDLSRRGRPAGRDRLLRGGPGMGVPGTAPWYGGYPDAGRVRDRRPGDRRPGDGAGVSAGAPARLLFAGGPIRPVAGPDLPQAVAVAGDTLLEVGSLAGCRDALGRGHQEVDLAGATLVPGFVDAHCHPLMLGQTSTWVDVSPAHAPDIPALVKLLAQQAAVLPPGEPLRAYGYNHRALPERRHPTAADLDQAAADREIYVMNQSGHGGVLNTAGLARCGITAATPDIPGGHIGRDASRPAGRPGHGRRLRPADRPGRGQAGPDTGPTCTCRPHRARRPAGWTTRSGRSWPRA